MPQKKTTKKPKAQKYDLLNSVYMEEATGRLVFQFKTAAGKDVEFVVPVSEDELSDLEFAVAAAQERYDEEMEALDEKMTKLRT